MNNQMDLVGVYDFSRNVILIEMVINEYPNNIDYMNFHVPDNTIDKSN